jgi:uncharacterized membrane protein
MTARIPLTALDKACYAVGGLIVLAGLAVVVVGPAGDLPIHYGPDGAADDWAGRKVVGALIAGLGALLLTLGGGMGRAAAAAGDDARQRGLRASQLTVLLVLTGVALFAAGTSLSRTESLSHAIPMAGTSLLLLAAGAFLGRAAPNPFVGVRTPWSYKSRLAWDRSNRLAGRLLCLIGLAGLAASAFAPQPAGTFALVAAALIAGVWSVFESWRVWRADPDRQPF